VNSYIHDSKITASGNITITADESATIISTDESIASSSGGSAFGEGKSLAINGLIATNLILSSADAHITDSDITTTNSGSILVDARNTSEIDATIISATSSGDTAVGVTLAFNTIGWESQNILFRTIDALIGTDIGDEKPAETKAYIENTSIDANGDISVLAKNIAIINATITNAADSQASALFGASGKSASGMLASNMVSSGVNAAITSTDTRQTINANGDIIIVATDSAGIYSNTKVVSSSVTSNNVGMGIVAETLSDLTEVDFLSQDGAQDLSYGDKVLLADDYSNGGTAARPMPIFQTAIFKQHQAMSLYMPAIHPLLMPKPCHRQHQAIKGFPAPLPLIPLDAIRATGKHVLSVASVSTYVSVNNSCLCL
jgi:hypothetical protein